MNVDAFGPFAVEPYAALPLADSDADFDGPPMLVKGGEPGDVVILIEADTFSGA